MVASDEKAMMWCILVFFREVVVGVGLKHLVMIYKENERLLLICRKDKLEVVTQVVDDSDHVVFKMGMGHDPRGTNKM